VVIGWPRASQTVSQYAANWQRDHLGDEFRFNYSPIGVERERGRQMGQIVRRNCTLKETARERANEQERERRSLIVTKHPNCLG